MRLATPGVPAYPEKTRRSGFEWTLYILAGIGVAAAVIASTYLLDKPKLLLGLMGAPLYIWMSLRWPELGILALVGLLIGTIDWHWLPLLGFGPFSLHIYDLMLAWLLARLFFRATSSRHFRLYYSPLLVAVTLFIAALAIASIHSVFFLGLNLNEVFRRDRVMAQWLVLIPTIQLLRDERSVRRLLTGLWILTAILAVGALVRPYIPLHKAILPVRDMTLSTAGQTFEGVERIYFDGDRLLFIMIPVTVASLAIVPSSEKSRSWFLARLLLLGVLLVWLFKSFQRNYWLTTAANLLILFVLFRARDRWRLTWRMAPVMVLLTASLLVYQSFYSLDLGKLGVIATNRLESLLNDPGQSDTSVEWRLVETRYAVERVRENPVIGFGIARMYRPPMIEELEGNYELGWYVHNSYLWVAVMMGLMGLIPFMGLILAFMWRCLRYWHTIPDAELRAIVLGLGVAFVGLSVSNLVAPHYIQGPSLVVYPVVMGICETILRQARENRSHTGIRLRAN